MSLRRLSCLVAPVLLAACAGDPAPVDSAATTGAIAPALAAITADGLLQHVRALSDDSLEGRKPGTPGEEKAVAYLTNQFKALGLAPGNPDGSYVQDVTLLGFTAHPEASFRVGGTTIPLTFPTDYVAVSRHDRPVIDVNAELVFVGYGVQAPEYGWDDYKGLDVKGKVLVMLVNDPAVPNPKDSTQLDPAMFKGSAMTYYGRWTYKYEIATAKGAAGAIIIHETGPAGYPFEVVSGSWGRENFDIAQPEAQNTRTLVESWITQPKAEALFTAAGKNFAQLKAAATRKDFKPVSLGATASFHIRNETRTVKSRNVVATLPGRDATKASEYVIYSAHWDHLGRDTTLVGDQIYNGALDNASGCAALLELAKAYTKLPERPARSLMFIALTGEEQGLIGAKYFAEHPLVPLNQVLANLNMDGFNQWGRTKDLVVVGYGNSTLEDVLADVIKPAGRVLAPDPEPEKGFYFRSDHFEFAKKGVPALFLDAGTEFVGKDPAYSKTKREEYTARDYHKPSDDVKADWDLSGAVEDTRALFEVGYRVLGGTTWPEWKPGTEFKAARDAAMAAKR
ncbi:MAG: M28 family metallopeptidase [Gemmatimonadaceae bacterium]